ncbi:MAR-binding filament-like protein 1-1 isoform 2 [Quillaja saponaria]|uniref:MAR-binding filament-like protein 1-1 isoform 2 n=1 Tax=Quillaja saponaria TaxID=32244 RepID=A0AAD7Q5H5_QUISA|nr:MAR-binding filament-like protein 1-1 isoform 2 [Quillaja saponaria]
MACLQHINANCSFLMDKGAIPFVGISAWPFVQLEGRACRGSMRGNIFPLRFYGEQASFSRKRMYNTVTKKVSFSISRSTSSPNPRGSGDESTDQAKTPFGYTRKDVLLLGVGVTVLGIGLKSGLEFAGLDPLQAGNVVQLVLVLGLTIGWISTYIFRVSNKEMTYAQQLRDYENKVMEKRLEGLTEAELQILLEQVEEDKRRLARGEQVN